VNGPQQDGVVDQQSYPRDLVIRLDGLKDSL
jgi:hypothetical protein